MLNYLIDDVRLRTYLIVFLAVVLACGWLYSCLTEHGHGVNTPGLGFLEGVFFSIVTVTSLGYGDIYPVGFSRVIAGAEVLFGLSLMGIMIAKVSSRRLSYHVQRLFASDAQARLDNFAERFSRIRTSLTKITPLLSGIYVQTPDPRPPNSSKVEVLVDFRRAIERFYTSSLALQEYFAGIRLAGDSSTNTGRNSRNGLGTLEVPNGNGAVNCIGSIGASPLRVTIPAWVGRS